MFKIISKKLDFFRSNLIEQLPSISNICFFVQCFEKNVQGQILVFLIKENII